MFWCFWAPNNSKIRNIENEKIQSFDVLVFSGLPKILKSEKLKNALFELPKNERIPEFKNSKIQKFRFAAVSGVQEFNSKIQKGTNVAVSGFSGFQNFKIERRIINSNCRCFGSSSFPKLKSKN